MPQALSLVSLDLPCQGRVPASLSELSDPVCHALDHPEPVWQLHFPGRCMLNCRGSTSVRQPGDHTESSGGPDYALAVFDLIRLSQKSICVHHINSLTGQRLSTGAEPSMCDLKSSKSNSLLQNSLCLHK